MIRNFTNFIKWALWSLFHRKKWFIVEALTEERIRFYEKEIKYLIKQEHEAISRLRRVAYISGWMKNPSFLGICPACSKAMTVTKKKYKSAPSEIFKFYFCDNCKYEYVRILKLRKAI